MLTFKTKKVSKEEKFLVRVICDVCKKEYDMKHIEDEMEIQEFHHIRFTGGYSSVFGDGVTMESNICQHCLKKMFDKYLRVIQE